MRPWIITTPPEINVKPLVTPIFKHKSDRVNQKSSKVVLPLKGRFQNLYHKVHGPLQYHVDIVFKNRYIIASHLAEVKLSRVVNGMLWTPVPRENELFLWPYQAKKVSLFFFAFMLSAIVLFQFPIIRSFLHLCLRSSAWPVWSCLSNSLLFLPLLQHVKHAPCRGLWTSTFSLRIFFPRQSHTSFTSFTSLLRWCLLGEIFPDQLT